MIEKEKVQYTDDGLEAIIFTAQGDMRQVCAVAAMRRGPPVCAMPLPLRGRGSASGTAERSQREGRWGLGPTDSRLARRVFS